jgi:hypothetical protein
MKIRNIRVLATVLILGPTILASLVGVVLVATFAPRLPDPIAVHWGIGGTVDRTDSLSSVLVTSAVFAPLLALVVAVVFLLMTRQAAATLFTRALVGVGAGVGVLVGLLPLSFVLAQLDAPSALDVPVSAAAPGIAIAFVLATAVGVGLAFVIPVQPVDFPVVDNAPAIDIAAGEKAYWGRTAWPQPVAFGIFVGAILIVVATLIIAGSPWWLVVLFVAVFGILATTLAWHVVVDTRGVRVTAALGFPRFVFPLAEITGARSVDAAPMREYGGWGIRFGVNGNWGVIVRSGGALELSREGKAPFVITVDDAETAARLISGLTKTRA